MSQICCQRKLPVVTASKHIMAGVAARCAGRALLRPVIFGGDGDGYCCSSRRKGFCEEGFSGMQWSRRLMNVVAHLQRCADLRLMGLAWLCTQKGGFFWGFACFLATEETGCIFMVEPRMPAATFSSKKRLKSVVTKAAARDSLYAILNVSPSATEKEIKQAYRRLALKYHPDVNKAPDAQAKFLEIKHAYQTLSDVNSRRKYDATRTSSPSWEPFTWDDASRTQTQSKTGAKEEFYGLDDFLRDLQSEFEQKSSQGQPKSLWEELADIGEEFVEFLEKELDIVDESGVYREPARKGNLYEYDLKNDESATERKSRAESDGKEIEEMLAQLKKELGL